MMWVWNETRLAIGCIVLVLMVAAVVVLLLRWLF